MSAVSDILGKYKMCLLIGKSISYFSGTLTLVPMKVYLKVFAIQLDIFDPNAHFVHLSLIE